MDYIVQYWVEFSFSIAGAWMVAVLKKTKRENSAIRAGMQAILRDRIIQAYNHYHDKGYCPIYARENAKNMLDAYHDLGGNGIATELFERMMKLPTEGECGE